jgi:hypothetical protein
MSMENFNVPAGKIRFVILGQEERRVIHQYLDINLPELKKLSVPCKRLDVERIERFVKCDGCGSKIMLEYYLGTMENNRDEYYSGWCQKGCEEGRFVWECNYDDDDEIIRCNVKYKYLVFGDYPFHPPTHTTRGDADLVSVQRILSDKTFYTVDSPCDQELSDKKLGWYLWESTPG